MVESLNSLSCLGEIILLHIYCVLRYTTARLQVLFSSRHLGGITKGCSNNYDSESLLLYIFTFISLTQLYSNLVYNEHDTTYLCLVLDVLVSPKISRFRLASLCTLLLSPVASPLSIIILHSLANDSLILIQENKGGPTPGH